MMYRQLQKSNYNTLQSAVMNKLTVEILYDNYPLNENVFLLNSNSKDSIFIDNLIHRVLLVIPEKSCDVCYDEVFNVIEFSEKELHMPIDIVTTITRYREVKNILADLQIKTNLYYSPSSITFEGINIEFAPFFMFIDNNYVCRNLFIPMTNHTELTEIYINTTKKRYFSLNL
jgi:hypothetical protein